MRKGYKMGKRCFRCREVKRLEDFCSNKSRKDGLADQCRKCGSFYRRRWGKEHREKYREGQRKYRERNHEKALEMTRSWRKRNKVRGVVYQKKWRLANLEKAKAIDRRYREGHRETIATNMAKRNSSRNGLGGGFTTAEWQEVKKNHDFRCVVCGRQEPEISLTVDHIIPISRWENWILEYGEPDYKANDIENIQPLCLHCNQSKGSKILNLGDEKEKGGVTK